MRPLNWVERLARWVECWRNRRALFRIGNAYLWICQTHVYNQDESDALDILICARAVLEREYAEI